MQIIWMEIVSLETIQDSKQSSIRNKTYSTIGACTGLTNNRLEKRFREKEPILLNATQHENDGYRARVINKIVIEIRQCLLYV